MNRKSKIIVSVVGITIVLLALLGITYAYYLTRIQGNTNDNSISVTTADLKLVYGDGESELVTMTDIMPGTVIEKDFTVTNSGESKVEGYLVVLEDVINDLSRKTDLTYTLTCKLSNNTSCGEISETIYPNTMDYALIFTNDIEIGVTQYYTLTLTYENKPEDQSIDMGSTISGKVNILDSTQTTLTGSPFVHNYLATDIIKNNGGMSSITEVTNYNVAVETADYGLYKAEDNGGTSYYYRGDPQNNYVQFGSWAENGYYEDEMGNPMYWKIVRINSDGTIRLAYFGDAKADLNHGDDVDGFYINTSTYNTNYSNVDFTSSEIDEILGTWYESNLLENYGTYVADSGFCNDTSMIDDTHYNAFNRLITNKSPSLICADENILTLSNDGLFSPVGLITADEYFMAAGTDGKTSYFGDDVGSTWWSMTSAYYDESDDTDGYPYYMFYIDSGSLSYENGHIEANNQYIRPVINIKADVPFTGNGTYETPYVIDTDE